MVHSFSRVRCEPDEVVAPYERTLKGAGIHIRRAWTERVFASISKVSAKDDSILILASRDYAQFLVPLLRRRGNPVTLPLEGLNQGAGLSKLTAMVASLE